MRPLLLATGLCVFLFAPPEVFAQAPQNPDADLKEFEKLMDQEILENMESEEYEGDKPLGSKALKRLDLMEERLKKVEGMTRQRATTFGTRGNALGATSTGVNRLFNPAISLNALVLGAYRSEGNRKKSGESDHAHGDELSTGLDIQELELNAVAFVDNYLRGVAVLALHDLENIEIEETYVDFVPFQNLSLRAGKYFTPFGRHNLLHTHQFPFIDAPLANIAVLGEEDGVNEIALGLNPILPLPWFSEINFLIMDGRNEELFNSDFSDDLAYLIHSKNLWDLGENTTLELGGSYSFGQNGTSFEDNRTHVVGGDMTLIWSPLNRTRFRSLIWQSEYLAKFKTGPFDPATGFAGPDEDVGGVYTFVQYQIHQRWWIQGRYGFVGLHQDDQGEEDTHRYSALLAFANSEFQAIRLQYNYIDYENSGSRGFDNEHQVLLQLNFTIGSHPAHTY